MQLNLKSVIFRFWENKEIRNQSYTFGLALVTIVGGRFAWIAWHYGTHIDRFLAIVAGAAMIAIAVVTMYRFSAVDPVQTIHQAHAWPGTAERAVPSPGEHRAAAAAIAASNQSMAAGARALGPPSRTLFR
ncbi:MAG: hypothetical protein HY918_05740 [Candidatus Doudnabacteria bacterium]|nr:hypothetical protein [Candidatus Doudnabacteria bacterium]